MGIDVLSLGDLLLGTVFHILHLPFSPHPHVLNLLPHLDDYVIKPLGTEQPFKGAECNFFTVLNQ